MDIESFSRTILEVVDCQTRLRGTKDVHNILVLLIRSSVLPYLQRGTSKFWKNQKFSSCSTLVERTHIVTRNHIREHNSFLYKHLRHSTQSNVTPSKIRCYKLNLFLITEQKQLYNSLKRTFKLASRSIIIGHKGNSG